MIAHGLAKIPSERPTTALALMDEAELALRSGTARGPSRPIAKPAQPLSAPREDATTDDLPAPDFSARAASDTDEEPLAPGGAWPTVERVEAPPSAAEPIPEPRSKPARRESGPEQDAALAPTVADTIPKSPLATPAARPAPPRSAMHRWAVLATVAAALVAGGFFFGSSGSVSEKPAASQASRSVTAAAFTVSVPRAWTRRTLTPRIEGLALRDAVSYGPPQRHAAMMLAGIAPHAAGPMLLAPAFQRRLPSKPASGDRVVLARELQAQRYENLLPEGAESRLTLLAVPTSGGTLTVVCREGGAGEEFAAACQRAAASLRLRRSRAFGLGADEQYGIRLRRTLKRLEQRRGPALSRLRGARTSDSQARRASAIAAAYAGAARSLSAAPANPLVREHHAAIRKALRTQAVRYIALSRAARSERPKTYERAVAAIKKGEARVRKAIVAFGEIGYVR